VDYKYTSEKGNDIWLMQGDCLERMKEIPDGSVDMIFTSPPYADRRKNCYEGYHSSKYVDWFKEVAVEIKRVLSPTGSFFLNIKAHCDKGERDLYVMKLVIALKEDVGFRYTDEFCWTKLGVAGKFIGRFKNAHEPIYHFTKEKGYKHFPYNVATEATEESKKRYKRKACGESKNGSGFAGMRKEITSNLALPSNHIHMPQKVNQHAIEKAHPAVFPWQLPEWFIKAFSEEGDVILDPFMGSGSTGVASDNLKRDFIGIEMDESYINLARKRVVDKQ